MKLGILGGTFDPIHLGHLITAETALDAAKLDEVLLVPTGCSYFKADQKVTSAALRYEMTSAAAAGHARLRVSDVETSRPGNSYTAETLKELHRQYPEDSLYYIVGADTLVMMSLWKDPQTIFDLSTVLVMTRSDEVSREGLADEVKRLGTDYGAQIAVLPCKNIEISSTEIRERVRQGRSIRYLVPPQVEAFIYRQGLYRE